MRAVQGCWNPVNVINLVKLGIDLFDTSYCHVLTERSAAMTFAIESCDESNSCEINLRDARYLVKKCIFSCYFFFLQICG